MIKDINQAHRCPSIFYQIAATVLFLFIATILISCHAKNDPNQSSEQKAHNFLRPQLAIGESLADIEQKSGKPLNQYKTQNGELSLSFMFSDENKAAQTAGVGGFTAFFQNDQLSHWEPVYESTSYPSTDSSSTRHSSVSFHSDKPVISFYIVSAEPKPGWDYVDNKEYPKLGYINKTADLVIFSGQYTAYDSVDGGHGIDFDFLPMDAEKLKNLTSSNVGNQVAFMIGSQVVTDPRILAPISDGKMSLTLSDSSYLAVLQALKNNQ